MAGILFNSDRDDGVKLECSVQPACSASVYWNLPPVQELTAVCGRGHVSIAAGGPWEVGLVRTRLAASVLRKDRLGLVPGGSCFKSWRRPETKGLRQLAVITTG